MWSQLNGLDYTLIGLLGFSILISFIRGFAREAISLASWIVAGVLSFKYAVLLSQKISPTWIQSQTLRYTLAVIAIFIAVLMIGMVINMIIRLLFSKNMSVNFFDRIFGVCFGAVRGGFMIAVLLLLVHISPFNHTTWLQQSKIAPYFNPVVVKLYDQLPNKIGQT